METNKDSVSLKQEKANLQSKIAEAVGKGEDFAALAVEYATVSQLLHKEELASKAGEINQAKGELAVQFKVLVETADIATLIGEAVHTIVFKMVEGTPSVLLNPTKVGKGAGRGPATRGKTGKWKVVDANGVEWVDAKLYLDEYYIPNLPPGEEPHSHYHKWATRLATEVAGKLNHKVLELNGS